MSRIHGVSNKILRALPTKRYAVLFSHVPNFAATHGATQSSTQEERAQKKTARAHQQHNAAAKQHDTPQQRQQLLNLTLYALLQRLMASQPAGKTRAWRPLFSLTAAVHQQKTIAARAQPQRSTICNRTTTTLVIAGIQTAAATQRYLPLLQHNLFWMFSGRDPRGVLFSTAIQPYTTLLQPLLWPLATAGRWLCRYRHGTGIACFSFLGQRQKTHRYPFCNLSWPLQLADSRGVLLTTATQLRCP